MSRRSAGERILSPARGMLFQSLRGYRKAWLGADLLAGLSLLVIAVPEQLATSRLAGMPPVTGLYAFIAGTVLFAALGSSPQLSVGADSTIAPLFAVAVGGFAATGSPRYIALVGVLALAVGVLVALVGLLRLGWIAEFLSTPIVRGFLGGVALIIIVHQLPELLGIAASSGSTVHRLGGTLPHLGAANGPTVGVALAVIVVVVGAELIDRRVPGALIALIASTGAVAVFGLREKGVAVLGSVAKGVPHLGVQHLSGTTLDHLAPSAAVVALVVVSQSAATTRAFADRGGYRVDLNRDFVGVGAGSIAAAVVGAFPVNASPPRTAAVAEASGKTQAAGLGAAVVVAALIPAAGLLRDLPEATMAAILVLVALRMFPLRDLIDIAHFDLVEFALALVTLLTVFLVGVQVGIGVAVGLAILDRTRLSARPQLHVLGRIPGTTSWAPLSVSETVHQVPGVLVVLFATPLWYANSAHFRAEFDAALSRAVGTLSLVVLDATGMSDIDYTGAAALSRILDDLDQAHLRFVIARAGAHVRSGLQRSGLLDRIGAEYLFASVDEAVTAF